MIFLELSLKVPYIFVHYGRILGKNPDNPGTEHFCMPDMPNYPGTKNVSRRSKVSSASEASDPQNSSNIVEEDAIESNFMDKKENETFDGRFLNFEHQNIFLDKNQEKEDSMEKEDIETDIKNEEDTSILCEDSKILAETQNEEKDYGPANIIKEKSGAYMLYESKLYPGYTYRFQLYGYLKHEPIYYKCSYCAKVRANLGRVFINFQINFNWTF